MKTKRSKLRVILGYAGFFFIIALTVTVALLVYSGIEHFNQRTVSLIMFGAIIALAALCTAADVLIRKFTVQRPVNSILEATEKISEGDFSVRLEIKHPLSRYDEFDSIKENLNLMAEELSKNEVLKNDFISNVSHEIKTPLSVIQNYATALQNRNLTQEERDRYTKTLAGAAARLTDLVMNILKLNKLENQQIKPEFVDVRLDELLAQTIFAFEEPIENKRLNLTCDLDEITVRTSPSHLETVWNNLLSNAVKFTPDGGDIGISLKRENGCAVVKVTDTGCGISAETGRHIFDKFYQGDTSHSQEGNGLGLALVKKVIDVLGGEISVESEVGKGSTFTVVLKGAENERQR